MATQMTASEAATLDGVVRLNRPDPLRYRVQEQLRDLIVDRVLAPGSHLVEVDLAGRLGVSRGPVREALQTLRLEGWVDLHSGRGAFVHMPSDSEVDETFAVRGALESEAAGLAAPQIGGPESKHLRGLAFRGGKPSMPGMTPEQLPPTQISTLASRGIQACACSPST